MKKTLFGVVCAGTILGAMPAFAVVNTCVRMADGMCAAQDSVQYPEWAIYCGTLNIQGIGVCAVSANSPTDFLSASGTYGGNTHCWCKMTQPAISKWILATYYGNVSDCLTTCNSRCQSLALSNTDIFYSNLIY